MPAGFTPHMIKVDKSTWRVQFFWVQFFWGAVEEVDTQLLFNETQLIAKVLPNYDVPYLTLPIVYIF